MTLKTTGTTHDAGVPPAPPKAHQRADDFSIKGEGGMATVANGNPSGLSVRQLLKVLAAAILASCVVVALAFAANQVLGVFALLLVGFTFTFGIAPALAGRMIAALILACRERQARQVEGGPR